MDGRPVADAEAVPVSPVWQLAPCKQRVRCAQCRAVISEGELMAWHPLSRLAYHPPCAGIASAGEVLSPAPVYARPNDRRAA